MKVDQVMTEDEAALYDRQIRLWGVDAQKKLLASSILIINMSGLAAEISKNLVLSGINSITILDSNEVTEAETKMNFLLPNSTIGKNRAEACVGELLRLNPMVKVVADKEKVEEKEASYFSKDNFDLVCALIDDRDILEKINSYCRNNNVLFLSGFVTGMYGHMFVDFNEFQYIAEATKITDDSAEKKKTLTEKEDEKVVDEDEKLKLQEKSIKFKSYKEFLETFHCPLEGLSANKMKRLSRTYFLNLVFNQFFIENKKQYNSNDEVDKNKLLEVKKSLFEKYKINENILLDSYFDAKKFEQNFCTVSVNAILGGTIGQEIIKAISKKNQPTENLFLFDGELMNGDIMKI